MPDQHVMNMQPIEHDGMLYSTPKAALVVVHRLPAEAHFSRRLISTGCHSQSCEPMASGLPTRMPTTDGQNFQENDLANKIC